MQSRDTRFTLRIESGERLGEVLDLPDGTLVVGRRPECGLVLKDSSVSGRHAELHVQGADVEVVDLGSTNGTRKDGHKIERAHLGHGEAVVFGSVRVVLLDATMDGKPLAPVVEPPTAVASTADAGALGPGGLGAGALGRVSADKVTRSTRGGRKLPAVLAVLLVLAVAGGAAAYFLRGKRAVGQQVVVAKVPGNLLGDGSFEDATDDWTTAEAAPQVFVRDRSHARSGDVGLGVSLEGDAWSYARSPELALHARRRVELSGEVRADGAILPRLGLELASADGSLIPFIAWAPAQRGNGSFENVTLGFDALAGYDRARVIVAATGAGTASFDDVALVEGDPRGNAARFTEYELVVLGEPGSTGALVRSGRTLLCGFDLSSWSRGGLSGWPEARLEVAPSERGFHMRFPGAPADAGLHFQAARAASTSERQEQSWIATTGSEGYAAHGDAFTRSGVTSLLLGSGLELLRIGFAQPVEVSGASGEGGYAIRIALGGLSECELQLTFGEERVEAGALAERADQRERAGEPGEALQVWSELLDRFPFERALVSRAEAARARLVESGLSEVDGIRRGLDRARFFALPELYREGRDAARELARKYQGTEVGTEASAAAELAQNEITALHAGTKDADTRLLEGVLQALDPGKAPRLTAHVQSVLQDVDLHTAQD